MNELDFFEAYCVVCNRRQKTKEMYLCERCSEPVCEDHSHGDENVRYCENCRAPQLTFREAFLLP